MNNMKPPATQQYYTPAVNTRNYRNENETNQV